MVLTIILVSLFAVSAVSATDNATSEVVGVEDISLDVVKQTTDDVGSEDQNNNIVKRTENQDNNEVGAAEGNGINGNVGTFSNLTAEINNAKHELNLTRNYTFTKIGVNAGDRFTTGIPINKEITINGNGFTIDGKNQASAFLILKTNNRIVLNNIIFKNCFSSSDGGAIYSCGSNVVISNCKFIDNSASGSSGAVQIVGENSIISNCTFINNKASNGGAILLEKQTTVSNCKFIDNSAGKLSGAIQIVGENSIISNCTFINNKASDGGAVVTKNKCTISDCSFINNNASNDGGAILLEKQTTVSNCKFIDNSARKLSGAIEISGENSIISNCTFMNNKASDGGAVFAENKCTISDCSFMNNNASDGGAILFVKETTISNCSFTNNTANRGGGIFVQETNSTVMNCRFTNNVANEDGAAFHVDVSSNNVIISNSNFTNNKARQVAALTILAQTTVSNCSFTNNTAYRAPAIWGERGPFTLINCRFTNNTASDLAGAICLANTTNSAINNCYFNNNAASSYGGAVLWENSKNSTIGNCYFINNHIKDNGGAIFWDCDNEGIMENSYFINNTANRGGAIYGGISANCSFVNNNVYNTTIQFNVKDNVACIGGTVLFYGLPECNLTVIATDKNGVSRTFECSDKGWNIGNLETGTYTVKFTIKQYDSNNGESTAQIEVRNKQIQELDELIRTTQNDTIILTYDYFCYDKGNLANGIIINKSVTIDGQGHKLDANNLMRIFQITNNAEVTFKNIIFANGQAKYGGFGAALWNNGAKNVTAINCTFENNVASYGGAISNVNALKCSFKNNSASNFGGAMWKGSAVNCSFIGNTAKYGGAIHSAQNAIDCSFTSNVASEFGGAMNGGSAVNCSFINNVANIGSAIYTGVADNCSFVGNNAYRTEIKFYINRNDILLLGDIVSFQGLPECNLTVTVTKDGFSKEFRCNDKGWKIEELELGAYNVQFNIDSDYNRGKLNTVMQLGYALDLSVNVEDIFVGQNETVRIFATNTTFSDNVTLTINGTNYTVNMVNGYGSRVVPDLAIGVYNVTVSFKGDKFWPVERSVQFEVAYTFDLDLTVSVEDIIQGQNETVKIHTIDIFNGNVTISLNGNNQTVNVVGGVGNWTYFEMPAGNYTVTVSFDGNASFNSDSKSAKFKVLPKQDLNLTVIVDNVYEGNMAKVYVTANELFDGEVKISINGTDIQNEILDISEGKGSYLVLLDAGNYTVTVSFDGDSSFNSDSKSAKFEVKSEKDKADLNLTVTVENIFVGDNATVKVTTDNAFNGKLILIIDGIVNDNITVENGVGSYTLKNLSAGNYAAYVVFNGDDTFKADAKSGLFEVKKHALNLAAGVVDIFAGQIETVQIHTIDLFNGNVTVFIGDNNYTVNVADGFGSQTASGLPVGNYTVTVIFDGDYKFNPDEKSVQFEVAPKFDLDLTVSVEDIIEGQNANVKIHTIDIFNGNVTISLNGNNQTVNVVGGVGNWTYFEMPAGNYTVTVSFDGNASFNSDSKSAKFKVLPKQDLNLTVIVDNVYEGNMAKVYVTANELFDGEVKISINGTDIQNETLDISDGKGSYLVLLGEGNYTVTVSFDGDASFNPDSKAAKFEVNPEKEKADLNLTVTVEDIFEGQNAIVKVSTNNTFTGNITVLIKGIVDGNIYVVNGSGSYSIKDLSQDSYNVYVGFDGDDTFEADVTVFQFNVKATVYNIIKNNDINMLYTANSPYKVLVTKNGNPVGAGEIVTITFNGRTYNVKTDANGYATLKLPNVKPKKTKYTITATYKGITVKNMVKVNSIIKASNKKVKKSKKVTKVKVSLKKVNGKYLKGKVLKIKFNKKTYKVKTNKKGVATWKVKKSMLKKLKVGKKYKYKVTYGKDVVTKKLTIKK